MTNRSREFGSNFFQERRRRSATSKAEQAFRAMKGEKDRLLPSHTSLVGADFDISNPSNPRFLSTTYRTEVVLQIFILVPEQQETHEEEVKVTHLDEYRGSNRLKKAGIGSKVASIIGAGAIAAATLFGGSPSAEAQGQSVGTPGPLPSGSVGSQRESTPTATPARNPNRPSSAQKLETVPGNLIVTFRQQPSQDRLSRINSVLPRANGANPDAPATPPRKLAPKIALLKTEPGNEEKAMAELRKQSDVLDVSPDYKGPLALTPNDPKFTSQQELLTIHAPEAWDIEPSMGSGVTVAVFDSGIKSNPDMATIAADDRKDFSGNPNPDDDHGTAVAGIIASQTNNGRGMAGVAGNVRLLDAKVAKNGIWTGSALIEAITWAVDRGANVGNLSLSATGSPCITAIQDRINYANSRNVALVAAVGNNGQANTQQGIAGCEHVISFGATTKDGSSRANISNYGPQVDLAAPGDGIIAPYPGSPDGYASWTGTSVSTPEGTGVVALMKKFYGLLSSPDAIEDKLCATSKKMADFRCGLVNAKDALTGILSAVPTPTPTLVPTPTPTPTFTPTPTSTPKPAGQCEPRPKVVTRVGKTGDGRLQFSLEATSNPGSTTPNEILSIRFGDFKNAEVTVAGSTTPIGPGGIINLSPPGTRATLILNRQVPGSSTVSLIVKDRCGDWPIFVGGGPSAF